MPAPRLACLGLAALLAALFPLVAAAQTDAERSIAASLGVVPPAIVASVAWLPDPGGTEALGGVHYFDEDSGNSFEVAFGLYRRGAEGFGLVGRIEGVFGLEPREAIFRADRIELTVTTLRDGEPQCCPTGTTRLSIDRATLTAQRLD